MHWYLVVGKNVLYIVLLKTTYGLHPNQSTKAEKEVGQIRQFLLSQNFLFQKNVRVFNNSGYCKFKETCRKRHIKEICQVTNCVKHMCVNRHPKNVNIFLPTNTASLVTAVRLSTR